MLTRHTGLVLTLAVGIAAACRAPAATHATPTGEATLAQVYYWKARPGMLDAYNKYITEVAEPIDVEAQKQDAFINVLTYQTRDTLSPWTHMRVFLLRDSAQLRGLGAALDAAGRRLEPDSLKRKARSDYAVTLRDRVGGTVLEIVR
jgi:hypothetical protein